MMGKSNSRNQSNAQKIKVLDLETNLTTTYDTIGEAARALNLRQSSISKYFIKNREKPFKGRYIFLASQIGNKKRLVNKLGVY